MPCFRFIPQNLALDTVEELRQYPQMLQEREKNSEIDVIHGANAKIRGSEAPAKRISM